MTFEAGTNDNEVEEVGDWLGNEFGEPSGLITLKNSLKISLHPGTILKPPPGLTISIQDPSFQYQTYVPKDNLPFVLDDNHFQI